MHAHLSPSHKRESAFVDVDDSIGVGAHLEIDCVMEAWSSSSRISRGRNWQHDKLGDGNEVGDGDDDGYGVPRHKKRDMSSPTKDLRKLIHEKERELEVSHM